MSRIIHIIDDEFDILSILERFFQRRGYTVVADLTGEIVGFEVMLPDIYLIDVDLGEKNGMDLCQLIKGRIKKTPVILMSASPRLASYAKECGADAFISKPFDMKKLISAAERLINK